jgi:hypothetical protein
MMLVRDGYPHAEVRRRKPGSVLAHQEGEALQGRMWLACDIRAEIATGCRNGSMDASSEIREAS